MKIVITGGSGLIGRKLIEELLRAPHKVTVLSRRPENVRKIFPAVHGEIWDAKTSNGLSSVLNGADAVINLAGESIAAKRWTQIHKERILSSRMETTQAIIDAIRQVKQKPSVLLNASAVGYYGNVPEGDVTEEHPKGIGFLADVCAQVESTALQAQDSGVRVVLLRTGVVLNRYGGALQKILLPFRLFIGGPMGSGIQWFPWIHLQDEVRAIVFAMENERMSGPLNLAAPDSIRMREFCRTLGRILRRPSWIPVPACALKLALGEMAEPLLLHGQKMIPQKLMDAGFKFQFPKLEDALTNLLL